MGRGVVNINAMDLNTAHKRFEHRPQSFTHNKRKWVLVTRLRTVALVTNRQRVDVTLALFTTKTSSGCTLLFVAMHGTLA